MTSLQTFPVTIRAMGPLAKAVPSAQIDVPQGTTAGLLLGLLGIEQKDVMLIFVNSCLATCTTPLTPHCTISLSPFICGG